MREYRYSALTAGGQTVTGVRRAGGAEELAHQLLQQGLVMLGSQATFGSWAQAFSPGHRKARKELREFTQHMATCLGAGITAITAISDFQESTSGLFEEILADIKGDVSSGTQLDEALARHSEIFSPVYLSLVAAGQKSGGLDEVFVELVRFLDWSDDLRAQTTQAMIYPAMLMTAIIGLFLLMMFFVMPRFEAVFSGANFELPPLTRHMMGLGDFLGQWWWALAFVGGSTAASLNAWFRTERGALWRDGLLLRLPVIGSFQSKLALSRFAKTFSLIYAAGVDLLRALDLMRGVVGNRVIARELQIVRQRVATGESLAEAFQDATVFPPLVQRLVAVGEKTGSLDTSLRKVSEHLDKEIPRDLKKAFSIFEGVVIVVLGALVCVAALSLLMPIMSIRADMG
jgi:type II secretory pathway component PulF